MEETKEMVELKKAYADIILNTAKEAAARVMSSERKALRFQRDLRSTNDEAVGMLLRFKHMIDSVNNEAKIRSSSQQRRIDELEAQLDETEEIILDLRTELKQAHDHLDKVRYNHVKPLKGQIEKQDGSCHGSPMHQNPTSSDPITSSPSDPGPKVIVISEMKITPFNQTILDNGYCTAKQTTSGKSHIENYQGDNPELASIIMKSKDPDIYRTEKAATSRFCTRHPMKSCQSSSVISHCKSYSFANNDDAKSGDGACSLPCPRSENTDLSAKDVGEFRLVEIATEQEKVLIDEAVLVQDADAAECPRVSESNLNVEMDNVPSTASELNNPKTSEATITAPSRLIKYTFSRKRKKKSLTSLVKVVDDASLEKSSMNRRLELKQNGPPEPLNSSLISEVYQDSQRGVQVANQVNEMFTITSFSSLQDQLTEPSQPRSFLFSYETCSVDSNVKSDEGRMNEESEPNMNTFLGSTNITRGTKDVREFGLTEIATEETELIDEAVLVQNANAAESPAVSEQPYLNLESNNAEASKAINRAPSQAPSALLEDICSRKRKKEALTSSTKRRLELNKMVLRNRRILA